MKFVSYMLFVLSLIMLRSYSHEREFFVKNASFWSWLCHLLLYPFLSCWWCLCSNCGYLACPCLNCSMLLRSLYIWEAHACICRLHSCITNKGEESTQFMIPGGALHQEKIGRNAFVQGELALMHLGALFTWILVVLFCRWCRAHLPGLQESKILEHFLSVVSSRCPCLRGLRFFSLKWSFLGFCLVFDHMFEFFIRFFSCSLFSEVVACVLLDGEI
jgi:hypothetical protein